jgi:hypothetical protein
MFIIKKENINNIENELQMEKGVPQKKYRVIIVEEDTGKIIYSWSSKGGMVCNVEVIKSLDKEHIEANHQVVGWGHPFTHFYSKERIDEFLRERSEDYLKLYKEYSK